MMESQRIVAFVRPAREKGAFVLGLSDPEERYTVGQALYHEIGEVRGGDALSEDTVACIRREDECRRARKAALSLLSYADNSRRRLLEKLLRKGISFAVAQKTVEDMVSEGLLLESRQLEYAVLSLAEHRLFGPYRILRDLSAKGYKSEDIRSALHMAMQRGDVDFSKNAALLIAKKLGDAPSSEEKRKLLFTYGYKK
ncbi:MAG: RecX family transcriptional regulator [Clostridia bacterium]|nr:RecX family transcriptional regulator [Clostridia bacterium]